jgi:putative transposase
VKLTVFLPWFTNEFATMALSRSALSDLLDALRAGGDLDVVREGLALVLRALIDAEAPQRFGAGRYEHTETHTAHRNGIRARLLSTEAGDVELHIPMLREGSFSRRCWSHAAASTGPCWR